MDTNKVILRIYMVHPNKYFEFNREFVNLQRVVGEVDRTVAQGWRQFVTRVLGTLPAPILFGYIIDNACTIWRTNFDGKQGNCWVYDLDR